LEQLKQDIPELLHEYPEQMEEKIPGAAVIEEININSPLLDKVRKNFGIFGGISIIFGGFFTLCFYKAGFSLNALFFTMVMVGLLCLIMKKLSVPIKKMTVFYYTSSILLSVSTVLTSSGILQFLNTVGVILLLELSLLHQLHEDDNWDFSKYLGKMIGMIFYGIVSIGMPFIDSIGFLRKTKLLKNKTSANILIGIAIALPFLWIILALLSSADQLFGNMTEGIVDFLASSSVIEVIIMTFIGFCICYCIICGATAGIGKNATKPKKKADATIAVTAMSLILIIYVLFCSIQFIYLFSNGLFLLPEEFTFAEYARRGFFELLAVTILNIALMLLCSAVFEDNKALRIILTGITVCTYIMIASATYRMLLYIEAYHLTFLRLFVLLSLFIDALVLAGVILAEYRKSFPLFRYCATVVTVSYLLFSFARPDYYIASYLVEHEELLNSEDVIYLTRDLSKDAASVVLPILSEPNRWEKESSLVEEREYDRIASWGSAEYYIDRYYSDIESVNQSHDFRNFNYSASKAAELIKKYPLKNVISGE
jgi:hypothetical protein